MGGHGKVFLAFDRERNHQLACKVVPLKGTDIHHHRQHTPDFEASTDLDEDAPTQDTHSYRPRRRQPNIGRKIHQLEVEYDILKDLAHVRYLTWLLDVHN